ncbi:Myomesin-1 [Cricetulus griseus]|uniref:Myomesin-1 n=1 Tax=Cricetulus griseus TaxID=10029 RepID=G3IA92_CRIGR|nr:Myomesin-1 [Cricetulus griseus]
MSLPFYQKSHQHYDLSYRNKDLRTTMSHYQQEKKRSAIYTHGSTAYSSRSSAAHRQESEAFSQASATSYQQQAAQAYSLGASQYSRGSEVSRKTASAYNYGYSHGLTDSSLLLEDYSSKLSPQTKRAKRSLLSGEETENLPDNYMVPIYSGRYKNQVPIDVHANPGKYIIESRYGMHTLEINKCDFEDTAQYRASAMNVQGELSAYASVVVKRYKGELDELRLHAGASMPLSFAVTPYGYASKFEIHFDDKFDVSFGREGETMSLGCRVVITPEIKQFQPEWSGDRATLTFSHLNKEDEGLYTIRVRMGEYYEQYSAYVFVRDADAEIEGAPAAPLDVVSLDANKDYITISWKQPAVDGGSPILGYFIDKCEVGTESWSQCNDTPVKFARFPVTGLIEGRSYIFRVRAVNKTGIGLPSRVSEPVAALDPAEKARLKSKPSSFLFIFPEP